MKSAFLMALLLVIGLVASAPAATVFTTVDTEAPLTDLAVDVTIQDIVGGVKVSLQLNPASNGDIGDITGLYLNYNGAVPTDVTISDVTSNDAGADASDIQYFTNQEFEPFGTYDMFFEIGGGGIGGDQLDVQMLMFNAVGSPVLTAANFESAAVRVQSFGQGQDRGGSLKLVDDTPGTVPDIPDEETPIPEPSTWLMLGAGLGLVSLAKMRRRKG